MQEQEWVVSGLIELGVNIDHVATVRQARGGRSPDPLQAAFMAVDAGADGITMHLREDRRHVQDRDVWRVREHIPARLNLEMAATDEMIAIARELRPHDCCLVPERRAELTTEGGLDVASQRERIGQVCSALQGAGVRVSLFIDPDTEQIDAAASAGADAVEIHTGRYADAVGAAAVEAAFGQIRDAVQAAADRGLRVNAGHGLDYQNVERVAALHQVAELNIGHSIVARAVMTGLGAAVRDMKRLMRGARAHG